MESSKIHRSSWERIEIRETKGDRSERRGSKKIALLILIPERRAKVLFSVLSLHSRFREPEAIIIERQEKCVLTYFPASRLLLSMLCVPGSRTLLHNVCLCTTRVPSPAPECA